MSKGDGKERETGKEKKIAHVSDATSGQASAEDYRRRLAYELGVIAKTGVLRLLPHRRRLRPMGPR